FFPQFFKSESAMQPMINIGLRAIRSANEQLMLALDRDGGKAATSQDLKKFLSQLEASYYDTLARALARAYPAHKIAKRGDFQGIEKGFSWHISNIHNPLSLLRNMPDWAISVVCKKNGVAEHALLTAPAQHDEFTASRGAGASLNGRRIRVGTLANLEHAIVSTNLLTTVNVDNTTPSPVFCELLNSAFQVRTSQCSALDLVQVAANRLDAVVLDQLIPMDLSAALLICKEAGALAGDLNGQPGTESNRRLVCAGPKLFKTTTQKLHALKDTTA